jgi:hypothetical protein
MTVARLQRCKYGWFLCVFILPGSKSNGWDVSAGVELDCCAGRHSELLIEDVVMELRELTAF